MWISHKSGSHLVVDICTLSATCIISKYHPAFSGCTHDKNCKNGSKSLFLDNYYCTKEFRNIDLMSGTKVRIDFAIYTVVLLTMFL